jgi:hypothetical protein
MKSLPRWFRCALLALMSGLPAYGNVLLTIDISNPGFVVISSTGAVPLVNDSSADSFNGVTLLGLFTQALSLDATLSGNLVPAGGIAPLDLMGNGYGSVTDFDLNLYNDNASNDPLIFSTSAPAFTGSATTTALTVGFNPSGNIIVGDTISGSGEVIGTWAVIPEPSSMILFAIALLFAVAVLSGKKNTWSSRP